MGLSKAYFDWLVHLALSPGKQLQLWHKSIRKTPGGAPGALRRPQRRGDPCIAPLPQDKRFDGQAWQQWPFNVMYQTFLLQQQWWYNAATGVRGVSGHHERIIEFAFRQMLDVFSPSNFVLTNPEILAKTQAEAGQNLVRGFWNFVEDWERAANGRPPVGTEKFVVGKNLATTPRQGRLPQPADGAHPIRAGDRPRAPRRRAPCRGRRRRSRPGNVGGWIAFSGEGDQVALASRPTLY